MPVYLIRHAHAGSRARWHSDDTNRPLSTKGVAQASAVAERLRTEPVRRIISSPALRCVQTVDRLAEQLGMRVEIDGRLMEGGDPDEALRLLDEASDDNAAMVSHGDLIPQIIRRLAVRGMHTEDPRVAQKGSIWILETVEGSPVRGIYVPPSTESG